MTRPICPTEDCRAERYRERLEDGTVKVWETCYRCQDIPARPKVEGSAEDLARWIATAKQWQEAAQGYARRVLHLENKLAKLMVRFGVEEA